MDSDLPVAGRGGLNPTSQTFHPNDWLNLQFSQRDEGQPEYPPPVNQASYGRLAGEQSWSALQSASMARDFLASDSPYNRGHQQTRYPSQSLPSNIDPALLEHNSAPMGYLGYSNPSSTPTNGLHHQVPLSPNSFDYANPNPGYGGYAKPQQILPFDIGDESFRGWSNTYHGPASDQRGGFQDSADENLSHAFDQYNPEAEPFTPTNRSSFPSRLPQPEPSFDYLENSNGPEENLHGPVGQDTNGTRYIAAAQPSTSLSGASVLSGTHLAQSARKRKGRPSKNATAIAHNVGPTFQPANVAAAPSMKFVSKKKSKYTDVAAVIPQMQSAVEKIKGRNDTDMLPDPPNLLPSGLYFVGPNEASLANWITFWESPANDNSIPTTQSDMEAWVHRLVRAMLNEQGCLRTNTDQESKSHTNRWSAGAQFYRRTAIEAVAWRLLQLAKNVHQVGWHEPIAEPKLRKDIYVSMDFTFGQRMQLVERVLQLSKTTCDALIKGNRFHELVGCPQVLFERTHDNEQANRLKREQLSTVKANKSRSMKSTGDQQAASGTKDDLGRSVTKRKLAETDEGSRSEAHASPSRQTTRSDKETSTTRIDDMASNVNPVNAGYAEVPSDIEEPHAPPVDQVDTSLTKQKRRRVPSDIEEPHAPPVDQVDTSLTKQKRRRAVDDTESEDEAPDASRKRRKLQARDLDGENDEDFSPAPTRGRTAKKSTRGKKALRPHAHPHGGD